MADCGRCLCCGREDVPIDGFACAFCCDDGDDGEDTLGTIAALIWGAYWLFE